ncbi:MAG: hypothetical protein D6798_00015 [Deltaproteobacteria bacterium]|nr:MAG: hypothetical protein D6798_00015 [Deltaproteobacteria bacterium]
MTPPPPSPGGESPDATAGDDVVTRPELADALTRGRSFLAATRAAGGGWPYVEGGPARPEPTVLCAAAGPGAEWVDREWLGSHDLGWAALLLPALAWERAPDVSAAALQRLDDLASVPVPPQHGFDSTLPGWSWVHGTAAWVEPTAFAMLSLRRTGRDPERLAQGQRLLLDRQCRDGGWNYGNPNVYGADLDSHLDATGWALLALSPDPAVDRGFSVLAGCLQRPSTLNLSLAALASEAHGRDPMPFLELLAPRVTPRGARGRVDLTAMACAALRLQVEGTNAFRPA